jgi:hypothetical protein
MRQVFAALLIVGFAAGGEFALIRPSPLGSLQSVWTLAVFGLLLILCAVYWATFTPVSRALAVLAGVVVGVAAVHALVLQPPLSYAGYTISGAACLLAVALSRSQPMMALGLRSFFWSAVVVSLIGVVLIPAGLAGDHRILQMTTAFAAIVIIARLEFKPSALWLQLIGVSSIAIASSLAYQDAARTSSLMLTLAGLSFLIFGQATPLWLRVALVVFQVTAITILYVMTDALGRWFGGDSGLTVGATTVNTNGRISMWSQALATNVPGADGEWLFAILGRGVGSSSISSMAVNNLPAPLNEFVRLYVDFGVLGLLVLIALLLALALRGARLFVSRNSRAAGVIILLTTAGYVAFSFSESMVAYSWVLVPTAMLVVTLMREHGMESQST